MEIKDGDSSAKSSVKLFWTTHHHIPEVGTLYIFFSHEFIMNSVVRLVQAHIMSTWYLCEP
jgi:hypothetical protein